MNMKCMQKGTWGSGIILLLRLRDIVLRIQ